MDVDPVSDKLDDGMPVCTLYRNHEQESCLSFPGPGPLIRFQAFALTVDPLCSAMTATTSTPSLFSVDDSANPTQALPTLDQVTISSSSSSSTSTLTLTGEDSDGDAGSDTGSSLSTSEYIAPLSGHAPDPSIDGTSNGGHSEEGGVRAESQDQVGEQEKQVSTQLAGSVVELVSACFFRVVSFVAT